MGNKKQKLLGVGLGILTIVGAFLSVFGNPVPQLSVDTHGTTVPQEVSSSTASPTPVNTASTTKPVSTPVSKPVSKPTPSGYTLADISSHKSATTCWSAINGTVYDLTKWVDRHPGGRMAILMICGKDGSPLFNMQHGGSSRISNILDTFKIGTLRA
jgi:cytochrome b involved in lipid metabolism